MYNESQKKQYIDYALSHSSSDTPNIIINAITSLFNNTEMYEDLYKKDIADMNYEELKLVLSRVVGISISTRCNNVSTIRSYIDWAISSGLSIQSENNANLLNVSDIDNSQDYQYFIYSPKELVDKCDILLSDYKEYRCDNILRVYLYLGFCGFTSKEIADLKESDVDIINHTVKSVRIYDEFWDAILSMLDLKYYYKPNRKGITQIPITNPTKLVKVLVTDIFKYTRKRLSEVKNNYKKKYGYEMVFSQSIVFMSGIYYNALLQERQFGTYDKKIIKNHKFKLYLFESDFQKYKEVALKR